MTMTMPTVVAPFQWKCRRGRRSSAVAPVEPPLDSNGSVAIGEFDVGLIVWGSICIRPYLAGTWLTKSLTEIAQSLSLRFGNNSSALWMNCGDHKKGGFFCGVRMSMHVSMIPGAGFRNIGNEIVGLWLLTRESVTMSAPRHQAVGPANNSSNHHRQKSHYDCFPLTPTYPPKNTTTARRL